MRALRNYELGHYIYFAELSHAVFHSALKSMIYFGPPPGKSGNRENRAQIVKRLPLLLPHVKEQEAEEIYDLHNDFKHEAQALQQVVTPAGSLAPSDRRRLHAAALLRECVRELLLKALTERTFADTLCNHDLLKQHYGVKTGQGIL
jgi:hypothetical protein